MRLTNSFIGVRGVGEATERRLWQQGMTRWADYDPAVARDCRGVGATTADRIEAFVDEAPERLDDRDAGFFDERLPSSERWRLYEDFRDEAAFFDIETTGLDEHRDSVTTVSVHRDGETRTLVNGGGTSPDHEPLTREHLDDALDAPLLVTFNGIRFDQPFLETSFDWTTDAAHLDLMYPCKRLGLDGGLKTIEQDVGIDRDRPDISGRDAVRLWREYERGDASSLETLVSYNREDTVNLRRLMDLVGERLHDEVFVAARDGGE
ncbi:ribonuclease H-like domain-containing protein [Haloglomus halophilum]|uniref:ribonuclease H-like domain-containing protein n=1 Tax=Haloglomus halophilum TaxID=2962672 RepID=UPI0020C9FD13|nr:ribonuclease H-like domain-containing protein [Haloglomus halophilum]